MGAKNIHKDVATDFIADFFTFFFIPPLSDVQKPIGGHKMTVRSERFRRGNLQVTKMSIIEMASHRVNAEGENAIKGSHCLEK